VPCYCSGQQTELALTEPQASRGWGQQWGPGCTRTGPLLRPSASTAGAPSGTALEAEEVPRTISRRSPSHSESQAGVRTGVQAEVQGVVLSYHGAQLLHQGHKQGRGREPEGQGLGSQVQGSGPEGGRGWGHRCRGRGQRGRGWGHRCRGRGQRGRGWGHRCRGRGQRGRGGGRCLTGNQPSPRP